MFTDEEQMLQEGQYEVAWRMDTEGLIEAVEGHGQIPEWMAREILLMRSDPLTTTTTT